MSENEPRPLGGGLRAFLPQIHGYSGFLLTHFMHHTQNAQRDTKIARFQVSWRARPLLVEASRLTFRKDLSIPLFKSHEER